MPKYIQIKVTNPCSEKWEAMQPTADGNYCSSCSKTVIDFSKMNDEQLIAYFKKPVKNVCGRFYNDQLEKEYALPVKRIPWLRYFFQITIPALLMNYKASAQHLLKRNIVAMELIESKSMPVELRGPFTVKGRISNFEGAPVQYASISVPGKNNTTTSDSNGLYTLHLDGPEQFIKINAIGYEQKLVNINTEQNDVKLKITTLENVVLVAGGSSSMICVTAGGVSRSVRVSSFWNRTQNSLPVPNKFSSSSLEIFPNPVKRNGQLTIRWKQPVTHDQLIIIYNAAGVKLLEKNIPVVKAISQASLNLDLHAAGYYSVQVIDTKTKLKVVLGFIGE